ncbi:porin PorA family protein [Gordonia shandongensis]|uniref:porin PorA family protein n=1 Tax=Gordonia shandongensis TaxID=376351 RepID=UPI0003FBE73A
MKRAALALLAFVGIACIVAAVAIPTYLVPKLRVVPLDLDITSVATTVPGDGQAGDRFPATIFDRCSITKKKAATMAAHLTQQRRSVIVEPSDAEQATLQSAQTVEIDRVRGADGAEHDLTMAADNDERGCDDALLTATIDRVSVNRKTSVPDGDVSSLQLASVPDGGSVDDVSVRLDDRHGFQYKFGFDVQKQDYLYYDTNTRSDATAKFVEEKEIDGVQTYHFVADVPETDLSELPDADDEAALGTILDMPARWWGIKGKGVKSKDVITMHRYAKATRHVYVEPQTGTIVYGMEDQHQYFKSPDPTAPRAVRDFQMDVLKGRFQWNDETVAQQASRTKDYLDQLRFGGLYAPIGLGVLGGLLLLAWLAFVILGRRRRTAGGPDDGGPDDTGPDGPVDPADGGSAPDSGSADPDTTDHRGWSNADQAATTVFARPTQSAPASPIPSVESPADVTDTAAYGIPVQPDTGGHPDRQDGNTQYGDTEYGDTQYGDTEYGADPYSDQRYGADQYGDQRYRADQYSDTQYRGDPYGVNQHRAEPYRIDPNPADSYWTAPASPEQPATGQPDDGFTPIVEDPAPDDPEPGDRAQQSNPYPFADPTRPMPDLSRYRRHGRD